jgi:hypothetical protein
MRVSGSKPQTGARRAAENPFDQLANRKQKFTVLNKHVRGGTRNVAR